MELRSTGNPDTSNPVAMSMLEYLRKKGIEAMGMTNGKRIRSMTDEELATLLLFLFQRILIELCILGFPANTQGRQKKPLIIIWNGSNSQ